MMTGRPFRGTCYLFIFCIFILVPFKGWASDATQSFELAGMYQDLLNDKSSGWYPLNGYIVFISDLERADRSLSIRDMRGKALLNTGDLIRLWAVSKCGKVDCDLSGWPKRSSEILKKYLNNNVQKPRLSRFHGHILENAPRGQRFRYAFAVPEAELDSFCKSIKHVKADPTALFCHLLDAAIEQENYFLAGQLLWDSGLYDLSACVVQKGFDEKICLSNFNLLPSPVSQRNSLRELLSGQLEATAENLHKIPGSYEILSEMADKISSQEPEKKYALLSVALPAGEEKVLEKMDDLSGESHFYGGQQVHIADLSIGSLGTLRFAEGIPSYDEGFLKQAMNLFHNGGDLNQIKELLFLSADLVPANPKVWDYLGAVFKTQKKWKEAKNTYLQLLQLRFLDTEALAHLAECYENLNHKNKAKLIADFLFYSGSAKKCDTANRIVRKIRGDNS